MPAPKSFFVIFCDRCYFDKQNLWTTSPLRALHFMSRDLAQKAIWNMPGAIQNLMIIREFEYVYGHGKKKQVGKCIDDGSGTYVEGVRQKWEEAKSNTEIC